MDYFELQPAPVEVVLNGETFELSPFSLKEMVYFGSVYGSRDNPETGIKFLHDTLKKKEVPFDLIVDITYRLLKDKDSYPSPCKLKSAIRGTKKKPRPIKDVTEIINHLYNAIVLNINNSQPIKDDEIEELFNSEDSKITSEDSKEIPKSLNWTSVYVQVANVISRTLEEFYNLTLRQIWGIYHETKRQKYNDLLLQGRLTGNVKPQSYKQPVVNGNTESAFSKEDDEEMTKAMNDLIKSKGNDGRRK